MQRDFHHTLIYCLCRLAGMKSKYCNIVAYCSMQVDDAAFGHALKFNEGCAFWQTRTAHSMLSRSIFDVSDAFNVWLPFHFLPGGDGKNTAQALITCPEGSANKFLKEDVLNQGNSPYGLHRLGIFLHVYADSYSHQDFKGYYDTHNDIKLISGRQLKNNRQLVREWFLKKISFLAPIGHGQALQNPDIPFAIWSYRRKGGKIIRVNNLQERFIPAMDNIYQFLLNYLEKNPQYRGKGKRIDLADYRIRFIKLLANRSNSRARHQLWLQLIRNNFLQLDDFDRIDATLDYHPRSWFKEAVQAIKAKGLKQRLETFTYNYYKFEKKAAFENSNWVLFMRAAAIHKYHVLHIILPRCGLTIT